MIATAALAASLLLLASCGGGGGDMSATTSGDRTSPPETPVLELLAFPVTDRARAQVRHEVQNGLASDHMPVAEDGIYRYVGVDQGEHIHTLAEAGERNGITLRYGTLNDGVGADAVRGYLQAVAGPDRYDTHPTVRVIGPSDAAERRRVEAAVRLVNAALPGGVKMELESAMPGFSLRSTIRNNGRRYADGTELANTIHIEFLNCADYYDCQGSGGTSWAPYSRTQSSYIQMSRGVAANSEDRMGTILLAHELLHALGLDEGHVSDTVDSILSSSHYIFGTGQSTPAPISVLYPIDREALQAFYADSTPLSLGPWSSTSMHIAGNAAHANFGVAQRNGYAEPWAHGLRPTTALSSNRSLTGMVEWNGALVGFTPQATAIVGDATIGVDLATLSGSAGFTDLAERMTGAEWLDGDLAYTIAVTGNTFVETGGDDGRLTGIFTGRRHEGAAGTLERSDLTAAFGASRD